MFTKEDLFKMDAVDVYKLVLEEKHIKRFPKGFWENPEAPQNAIKCTRYLMDVVLKSVEHRVKLNSNSFRNYKLGGMLKLIYQNSVYSAINSAYPNKFNPWDMPMTPLKYWNDKDNCIIAIKWLIEDKLKYNDYDIANNLSYKTFRDNNLGGLASIFNNDVYKLLDLAYPNRFKRENMLKQVPKGFYNDKDNRVRLIQSMIDDLGWDKYDIERNLTYHTFVDNGLGGLISSFYNYKVVDAMKEAFPGVYDNFKSTSFTRFKPIKE